MSSREAFSVNDFCSAHSISRSFFYRLESKGLGPRTFKIGDRTLISKEAAAEWRAQLEQRQTAATAGK